MTEITAPRAGLYLCSRTSLYEGQPCDEAFEIVITSVDVRFCDDPKKIRMNNGTDGDWYLKGANHRVEGGCIKRDVGTETRWAVEVLDIQAFVDKYGKCVVSLGADGFCQIEIYDDYRE